MDLIKIGRTYKNFRRLREILNVFAKYGFEYVIHRINLARHVTLRKRVVKPKELKKSDIFDSAVKIRSMFEELGPTFIKFGQILSLRADILPQHFIEELSKLQDAVKPFPFQEAKKILELSLGKPYDKVFSRVDEIPLASASISQVHYAVMKEGGEKVVIKIQRPGIKEEIKRDLDILFTLARLIEKHIPESKVYNPVGVVEEFGQAMSRELDFTYEMAHADKIRDFFKGSKTVHIPKVYFDHSGELVMIMEYIDGVKLSSTSNFPKHRKKVIARHLIDLYYVMVFERGFFQADPHPGNIFVMKNNVIGLVDFGMTGKLTQTNIKKFSYLVLSFMEKDLDINVEEYRLLGIVSEDEENVDFEKEAVMMMERYRRFPLDKINMGNVIYELSDLARKYGFKLNKDFVLLGKVFFTVESVIREIDPDFNFVEAAKPHALRFLKESVKPARLLNDAKTGALSIFSFLKTIPRDIGEIFKKIKKGELEIEFVHVGLEPLIREMDRATNRLTAAFIIGALIIGSSIITYSGVGPKFMEIPLYGFLGYFVAAFLGFVLVISILRSGKL
ncbi:MAG: hypothetical protein A2452_01905 [Candidatus Firestonebacteria bacterium RIFOXYC2_FULL_39_67]|nr:MAG: hypothetical protein A2536_12715 [Candidatus Firestonebacteria bacterium RIFOXYD2_FULL_39_29]OGF57069.1 MAG: hypothetical protein A2452_01905 [Candidatus Firestonebacteria bacterium RIFOXYC2_FULL_39_67]